jgi:3-oxoacyl-[acyl-carrier protein] reductase
VRFTETVAEEVKDFGIEVNAVLPGPLKTDMLDQIIESGEDVEKPDDDAIDRAASLCLWLAQTDGLTGRTLSARFDPWPFDDDEKKRIMASDLYTLRRIDREM